MSETGSDGSVSKGDRQRYRHLFQYAPICIFVADLTISRPIILEVNQRAELVYGYTTGEMIGMAISCLVAEDAWPVVLRIVERVQQGEMVTTETTNRRRDSSLFPVRVIAAPDPTDACHMIVTVEDITAENQRRSEAEAIDAERRRIAQEIHDGVAQDLAGLRFKSALWQHLSEGAPPDMRAALGELQAVLTDAIGDLRRVIFALRPVDLEAQGFFPALAQLVADFGDQNQIAAQLHVSGPQNALRERYELPLYRVIQESLSNIGQHARANSVQLRLDVDAAGGVTVSVRDDGCGFDPSQLAPKHPAGHFGLRQMRERILDLGGMLDIHSSPGQGTELVITLPPLISESSHAQNGGAGSIQKAGASHAAH